MTTGIDFTHQIPCPVRVGPKDTGPLPANNGFWSSIWSASGWWSDCDIHLEAPEEWGIGAGGGVKLRLWALTAGVRSLVAETKVGPTSGMKQIAGAGTQWRGIAISGRGHPGSGWLLEAQSPNPDVPFASATVSGELWGTESTPDGIGNTPGFTIADHPVGSRASMLMGWPIGAGDPALTPPAIGIDGPWLPVRVVPDGSGGGLFVFTSIPPLSLASYGAANQGLIGGLSPQAVTAISCNNTNAADRFIQLHESPAPVLAGAVPIVSFRVPAASTVMIGTDFFTVAGLRFSRARWAFSTTSGTFTAGAAADATVLVTYRAEVVEIGRAHV